MVILILLFGKRTDVIDNHRIHPYEDTDQHTLVVPLFTNRAQFRVIGIFQNSIVIIARVRGRLHRIWHAHPQFACSALATIKWTKGISVIGVPGIVRG